MKARVLNTFSISKCSEKIDVPNTFRTITMWKHCFAHFFHFKMFWQKWCSKHSCYNFHMKIHVLNIFSISKCSERNDVPNTLGAISLWLTFWTLFLFQDVLKEVMFQTILEQFPHENTRFEHLFHFKMFWKKWCSKHSWINFHVKENSPFEHFFYLKMFCKKWCSKQSWNNFHGKTHLLNTFSISRWFERSDVPSTPGTISTWKITFWTCFFISRCFERSDVPNAFGTISIWKIKFWTLVPFQDVLNEVMFQMPLEQFQYEKSSFEHLFHFKMFWKKWCSKPSWNNFRMKTHVLTFFSFQDILKEVILKKPSWNNFQMKTHVLNFSFISRCPERSDVQNTLGTISIWKLTFWTLFPFQDVLKEVMFQTLLEQFQHENSRFEHFFSFRDVLKEVMFKTLSEQFRNENSRSEFFFISKCSERSDVQNTLGRISMWKLTFWTLFPFQDVLKEVMFQTLLEQFPHENSRFEHFFSFQDVLKEVMFQTFLEQFPPGNSRSAHFSHFKMFWKKWYSGHSWDNFHMKTYVLNSFFISNVLKEVMFNSLLEQFPNENSCFDFLFISRYSERNDIEKTLLEQFPNENSRFEFFFHFKMFWKKWCSKHFWNNFHMKTHVLNTFSISRCSERSDVQNTLGAISLWLTFWTPFPFQDDLEEVMFQTLLGQFPCDSPFEHLFHFKMIWKKWCSKRSWNNFHQEIHVLHSFPISRCFERSDIPDTLGTISTWKLTFWILFSFQMFWKKWCSRPSWNNFQMKTHVLNFFHFKMFWKKWCSKHSWKNFMWKHMFWIFLSFQDVLKEVMFKTFLEQFPHENSRFEHFFHFKMFWKKWCSKHFWNNFHMKTLILNTFFHFKMFWKKWCSKPSWNNFQMKTHVLNFFHFKMFWKKWCSKHSWKNFMWKHMFWTLFPFQDILQEKMFQTLLEQFPFENSLFEHIFPFKMFWKRWCSKHPWNKFHMKTHVLNTFSISRCSETNDVPHTFRTLTMWKPCFEQFFHVKMFWQKWCSKHSCYNFHVKTHVLNTFLISRCSERSSIPNTLRTISTWKLAFWTLFRFQNVLKKLMSQTLFEQLPCENTVLHTFSISRCSDRSDVPSTLATIFTWKFTFWTFFPFQNVLKEMMFQTLLGQFPCDSPFEHFFYFKMCWKKWCSKQSWNNFHMKTHVLNICFISRCSERSDVPNTLELISMWKKTHLLNTFSISRCSARSDVPNTLEIISMGKLTFWTLFLFQDVLKEVMFQALLEQFPHEKSRFEHFFSFQDVLKEVMSQTPLEPFQYEKSSFEHLFHFKMFWKKWCSKCLWNNFNMRNQVLNTCSISRCSERSDVQNPLGTISEWKLTFWLSFHFKIFWKKWYWKNPLGTISKWKLTFWIFLSFQDVLKEVMFKTLLEQFPYENSHFEHFFHFKMFWKKWCSKHFWNNFNMKTLVLNTFFHFKMFWKKWCSKPSWNNFEMKTHVLIFFHFKMFWKKWCSKHSWKNFHVKTHILNTFSISRCSERSDVPNTLGTISTWKLTFWTLFSFQDVLKEVMFQHVLGTISRKFMKTFHFKMFWKKWYSGHSWDNFNENTFWNFKCSERSETASWNNFRMKTHVLIFFSFQDILKEMILKKPSWNNFQMKTHVLNFFFISRCSERSDVPNTFGTISTWKLTFWTLFPFDVLKEVMFKPSWNNFLFWIFFISRCSERSDVQNTLGRTHVLNTFSFQDFKMFLKEMFWCPTHFSNTYDVKTLFWAVFPCQDVLTEVMFQALLLQFSRENSRFEHFFDFKMFWKK